MEKKLYKLTKKQIRYSKVKDFIDRTAGVVGTVLLSPVFLGIVIAIKKEEGIKAPVFFKQKRVGKDQKLFNLYKFRTMKLSTPKDTPTHLLSNPEQYITSTGKFLRRSSLDELPQFLNIIKGDMAISGPRPALWNQDDLIAEREAYGVHQIKPGLTGWAQIHGRDELEIPVKAKLDAYYLQHFGLWIDIKCFFGTILSVLKSDGVVEGGTGEMKKIKHEEHPRKKVLLVANVAKEHVLKFHIPTIKMLSDNDWIIDVACSGEEQIPYCNVQYKMCYKRNPFSLKTIMGIYQLRKILKSQNYDIVSSHTPTGGLVARVATIGIQQKPYVIYTAHGFHFYKGAPLINWLVYFPIEWILGHFTDELVVINSEDYKNALKFKMGMKKVTLIHGMGVDKERFSAQVTDDEKETLRNSLHIPKDEFVFVYVAEILKNKNQQVLIKALKELRRDTGKGVLLLVGPIHDDGQLEDYINSMGLKEYVILTGWRNDVEKILAISNVCVASSIREGLGLNLIEAQFSGIPIIASNNRGHRDIIQDNINGFLVEYDDYKGYYRAMRNLMTDKDLADKFVKCGRNTSDKFSKDKSLERIGDIYLQAKKEM